MCADDKALARELAREVARRGGRAYYVGGCVRDKLLGRACTDVDVEVVGLDADETAEVMGSLGHVEEVGASFGVLNLRGHTLDVSAVAPGADVAEAARRRDLTINALYEDVLTGEIIDCFGGQADLAAGLIRHVDATTFVADPLRVMRAAQFAARLDMRVDEDTTRLCGIIDVSGLARERVLEELRKALLKAGRPSRFFCELRRMDQLVPWFVEVAALASVPQNPAFHPEGDVWCHTMLVVDAAAGMRGRAHDPFEFMLSALCHDLGKATTTELRVGRLVSYGHDKAGVELARTLLRRLGASKRTKSYVCAMVQLHMKPNMLVAARARQRSFNRMFDACPCPADLLLLARADDLGRGVGEGYDRSAYDDELAERLRCYEEIMARPYVQGRDLLEQGAEPGPELGEVLVLAHKLRLVGLSKDDQLRQCMGLYRKLMAKGAKPLLPRGCPMTKGV